MRQFLTDVSGLIVTEEQAAVAASPGGARDLGFARTMMFAGGASEVQKLVAQATAARQAAGNGATEPVAPTATAASSDAPAPAQPRGTPPPITTSRGTPSPPAPIAVPPDGGSGGTPGPGRPSHGAAIAATMIAMPAASGNSASGFASVDATPALPSSGGRTPPLYPTKPTGADAGANFRETLWFKKGDVDQMVADARAKVAAMANARKAAIPAEPELPPEDAKPLEDRYVDDGTVTVEDRQKFSLGSGGTSTAVPARGRAITGERMSDNEMINEIGGGKRVVIIGIVVAVVVALVAVVAVSMRGRSKDKGKANEVTSVPETMVPSLEKPAQAVAAPAANPPAREAPPAAPPAAEKPGPPAAAAQEQGKEEKPEPSPKAAAARKKIVAKKKPVPVKKHK